MFITASKAALLGVVLKLKQDNEDSEFVEVARKKTFFDMVFELYLLDVIQVVTKQSRGNCWSGFSDADLVASNVSVAF